MKQPVVSVVMSAYNQHYLRESVDSILAQSFTDFEFVIVDDSCSESTWELLSDLAARDGRVRLLRNEQNLGQTKSLNIGFAAARGQFIARQDDDDLSLPQRLEQQVAFMQNHAEVGLLGTQMQLIDADSRAFGQPTNHPLGNSDLQTQLLDHCCFCHGSVMLRRDWLNLAQLYDQDYKPADDYELWLRLAEHMQLANLPQVLYQFRHHVASTSRKRRHIQLLNTARALEHTVERRSRSGASPAQFATTAKYYLEAAIAAVIAEDVAFAKQALTVALRRYPALLAQAEPLQRYLTSFAYDESPETNAIWLKTFFSEVLPKTYKLGNLHSQFLSNLYMRAVFANVSARNFEHIDIYLWPGLRLNWRWLFNRGVLVLVLQSLRRRLGYQKPAQI